MSLGVDQARELMHAWVLNPSLRRHMECVGVCMAAAARGMEPALGPQDIDRWSICGLLHDFDYERHPTSDVHPFVGVKHLRARGDVDDEILTAILGHATYSGVPRQSPMAKHLFAVDELAGFIVACCQVRPGGIQGLTPKSVRKKLKTANFAAAVNRDDIELGCQELGRQPSEHIQSCIEALQGSAQELDLLG